MFICRLLTFFPDDRLTARECLAHPFLTSYMNTQDDSLKVPSSWPPLTIPSTAFQHERGGSNYDINCLYDEIVVEGESNLCYIIDNLPIDMIGYFV